jgi:glucans biosynthesis protein C
MKSSLPNPVRFIPAAALTESSAAAAPRWPGMDWLRALAALAVVALHAGIPYMTHPLPGLEWCVRSAATSSVVDALCWGINVVAMPTFFLMGGSLAAGVWSRRPENQFLVHRSQRLLLPLAFAVVVVLPADMYVWLIGWYTQGLIPWRKVLSIKLPSPLSEQFWGVAHLWYLQCLWTLSVLAWAITRIRSRAAGRAIESLTAPSRGLGWRGLWALSALFLFLRPAFLIGYQQTWWPHPAAVGFYGCFFFAGWRWKDDEPGAMHRGLTPPARRMVLTGALFPGLLWAIHRHVETPLEGPWLLGLTLLFTACSWLASTGLLAWARASTAALPRPVAFAAEGSFWMYLVHHPFAGLTQLALLNSNWPVELKFVTSFAAATGLSLASYWLIRKTWLGKMLDGRGRSTPVRSAAAAANPLPIERMVA